STTVSTTNNSTTATVASATGLSIGSSVNSANIPAGTTISNIVGTTLTLSAKATLTAAGTTFTNGHTLMKTGAGTVIDGTLGFRLDGVSANDQFGHAVTAKDVNGDGKADLIDAAWNANSNAGYTYVVCI